MALSSSENNKQLVLLLPIFLLAFANIPHVFFSEIAYTGYIWLASIQGIAQIAPLLLCIALSISKTPYRHEMQPLNAALSYFILSELLHILAPTSINTNYFSALISAFSIISCTPFIRRIRVPVWLHSFQGDAIVLMGNSFICILLSFPIAGILHLIHFELNQIQNEDLLLTIEPIFYISGSKIAQYSSQPAQWQSLLASKHSWIIMLSISWIFQHAITKIAGSKQQKLTLNVILSMLAILSGQIQPVLLLLLFWAPWHCVAALLMLGFINYSCHWLQLEQATYATLPQIWFAIPVTLFSLLAYELRHELARYPKAMFSSLFKSEHLTTTLKENEPDNHQDNLLLDVDYLTINYLKALGGLDNLVSLEANLTKLVVEVETVADINKQQLHEIGVMTVIVVSPQKAELMTGPIALTIESRIKSLAKRQSQDLTPRALHSLMPFKLDDV